MSQKTLSVYEHGSLHVAPGQLTQAQLDALARFNDAHCQRYFRLGHRRIIATSFVGYVQVGKLGIEILPKLDRGAPEGSKAAPWQSFLLEMLRVALGLQLHSPTSAARALGRPTLLDLVALRFVTEVERLLHQGLAKGYRENESNGSVFRGRLLVGAHARANCARADRFYVRYSTFDRDVRINRILAAALGILTHQTLSPAVRVRVGAAATVFPEVSSGAVTAEDCDRVCLTRSTLRYREAMTLARMILQHRAPELRGGLHEVFAVLFDMNVLWETYVGWLLRRAAPAGCDVLLQESRPFWQPRPGSARKVRPDMVLRDRSASRFVLVADAKWKALEGGIPDDDHLKQMFVYNHLFQANQGVLIHPTASEGQRRLSGTYLDRDHRCGTAEIGLFDGGRLRPEGMIAQMKELLTILQRTAQQNPPEPAPGLAATPTIG
jgi:5-methylcytosine-specific restriction enzyme subunit McrC